MRSLCIVLILLQSALSGAEVYGALLPEGPEDKLDPQAQALAKALVQGSQIGLGFKRSVLPLREPQGAWRPQALAQALGNTGPLLHREGAPGDDAALTWTAGPAKAVQLWAKGLPRVLLIENNSTVAPLSKGLKDWGFNAQVAPPEEVEREPRAWLDPQRYDLVVFSSPGWWDDFANPPGGPSRMGEGVVKALRAYVSAGGAAFFFDIAQWDLEKAWPKTARLAPLGPYKISTLSTLGGLKGGLNLAPVGVAADQLRSKSAVELIGSDRFAFPDGKRRPIQAAYAVADPEGGKGWILAWAFYPFEQDDSLANAGRRLFLNGLLLAGDKRLEIETEALPTFTATVSPSSTPTLEPSASPTPTFSETHTEVPSPTETWTSIPSPSATATWSPEAPTLEPSFTATNTFSVTPSLTHTVPPLPTPVATATEVPRATLVPMPRSTLTRIPPPPPLPSPIPSPPPTPRPLRSLPTLKPLRVQPTLRPARPLPTLRPTRAIPTLVPTRPVPTLQPTRPLPTWAPLATLVLPTSVPRPKILKPSPTAIPTQIILQSMPTVVLAQGVKNRLGCLASMPEPFDDGGVYLEFCLSEAALVSVSVFDPKGKRLWQEDPRRLDAGQFRSYFSGKVHGILVSPGGYLFEVSAKYADGRKESKQGSMKRQKRRR